MYMYIDVSIMKTLLLF